MKTKYLLPTFLSICFLLVGCSTVSNSHSTDGSLNNGTTSIDGDNQSSDNTPNGDENNGENTNNNLDSFKESMNNLSSYLINVGDATNLGIKKVEKIISRNRNEDSNPTETVQTLVKTTTEYNPLDPTINDGILNVTFKKIDTTITTNIVNGEVNLIAEEKDADKNEISINQISEDSFSFQTDVKHKYRIIDKDNNVIRDWFIGNNQTVLVDNLLIDEENTIDSYTIEKMSIDAFIEYKLIDNCSYSLFNGEDCIASDVSISNDSGAVFTDNKIIFDHLEEGTVYTLKYTYTGTETKIEQSEISAEIDKLYVYNSRFTFISFVPLGTSNRPDDKDLVFDHLGKAVYDQCDYYSGDDRQSFIIDNISGFIYQIKDFRIKEIKNNLILIDGVSLVYDFKVEDENIIIFPLYTNETLPVYCFYKDKYGNIVIENSQINQYVESTKTLFHRVERNSYDTNRYYLTNDNNLLYCNFAYNFDVGWDIKVQYVLSDFTKRDINVMDSFEIEIQIPENIYTTSAHITMKNGLLSYFYCDGGSAQYSQRILRLYDLQNKKYYYFSTERGNFDFYSEFDTIIFYASNVVYSLTINNIISTQNSLGELQNGYIWGNAFKFNDDTSWSYINSNSINYSDYNGINIVLDNCVLAGNVFVVYGLNGNEYYEIYVEVVNGVLEVNSYLQGTYVGEQKTIILQPIR